MSNHKPDKKSLKPMNLFESELLPFETIDIMTAAQPRYIVVYHHLNKSEAEKVIKYLQENSGKHGATITLPMMGRMVG